MARIATLGRWQAGLVLVATIGRQRLPIAIDVTGAHCYCDRAPCQRPKLAMGKRCS
jgi:hypothetical protein